jgi:hypothetical protein
MSQDLETTQEEVLPKWIYHCAVCFKQSEEVIPQSILHYIPQAIANHISWRHLEYLSKVPTILICTRCHIQYRTNGNPF